MTSQCRKRGRETRRKKTETARKMGEKGNQDEDIKEHDKGQN
jgi:hypothetical protein